MRKRIFSILLTLCMVLSLMPTVAFGADSYEVWVGGIQVTSDNANDVLGDGTVSYDAVSNTLTLNNASITNACTPMGSDYAAIYASTALNIHLNGINTVIAPAATTGNSYGVYCGNQLSITGAGSLCAMGGKANIYSFGIYSLYGVSIEDATVTTTGGKADYFSGGLYSNLGGISILGDATVTATAGKATDTTFGMSYGIWSASSTLMISDTATVTATAGEAGGNSYGIYSSGAFTISDNATVTATAGKANSNSVGVFSPDSVSISKNAKVTTTGGTITRRVTINK